MITLPVNGSASRIECSGELFYFTNGRQDLIIDAS